LFNSGLHWFFIPFYLRSMTLKLCVAQLNFVVGDLAGNAQKIIQAARSAYADDGARLLLTPELSICGYAAEDLFLAPCFHRRL
jgi:NAD+ synthase (glutamine-hydrolysing)